MKVVRRLRQAALLAVSAVAAVLASGLLIELQAVPAEAAGEIACSGITCTLTSRVSSGSVSDGGSGTGGGNGGGSGGGGGSAAPVYRYSFEKCTSWYSPNSINDHGDIFNSINAYPNPDYQKQTGWSCIIWTGGQSYLTCPVVSGNSAYGIYRQYAHSDTAMTNLLGYWCSYPAEQWLQPTITNYKVVTGGQGWFVKVSSPSAASWAPGGTQTDTTGYRKTGYQSGNPGTYNASLDETFNAKTGVTGSPPQPLYGYYSLRWQRDYASWQKKKWGAWMAAGDVWTFKGSSTEKTAEPYTYGCNLSPALQAGVVSGASFTAADCARQQQKWECSPTSAPQILGTSQPVQVMRDGADVIVKRGNMLARGSGIRSIRDQKEFNTVITTGAQAVSPLNGTDPHGVKQYFQADDWKWNAWTSYSPNANGTLHFYWSSDNGGSWRYSTKYRFTADFLVPVQGALNSPSIEQWVTDTADCGTVTSNTVTVVRSANG